LPDEFDSGKFKMVIDFIFTLLGIRISFLQEIIEQEQITKRDK
jgi:hypothetical protein